MELIIKGMTIPEAIEFNFDEIKQELSDKVSQYTGLVYADDQIKEAKKDVAELRKFTKALSDERIKVKKQCLKPYEDFETKVKALEAIANEPIALIDSQIKDFEKAQKAEKEAKIVEYFGNALNTALNWLKINQIWDDKWLNASVSMASIQKEIDSLLKQIENDMVVLANLPEFGFEALQEYKSSLDLAKAISEGHRLADMQRMKEEARKAEEERQRAEEARRAEEAKSTEIPESEIDDAVIIMASPTDDELPFPDVEESFVPDFDVNPAIWRTYRIELTSDQKLALEKFFEASGIKFEMV